MKREILNYKKGKIISGCCPGHDDWPNESYRNRRSIKARKRDKQKEHKYVRTLYKNSLNNFFDK